MIQLQSELANHFTLQTSPAGFPEVLLSVPENFSYFAGHFPDFPVLPAVALIDISSYFVKTLILKKELPLKKVSLLKIKAAVKPKDQIIIEILQNADLTFNARWAFPGSQPIEIADLTFAY